MWRSSARGGQGRSAESPRQIGLRGWLTVLFRAAKRIGAERLWIEAAGVAFFALLSLFPALVAAVSTYGLVTDPALVHDHLALARELMPASAYQVLEQRVTALVEQSSTSLGLSLFISLAVALWGASRGMNTMILVSGHAYREEEQRGFIARTLLAFALTIGAAGILLLSVFALGALPMILNVLLLDSGTQLLVQLLRWPILAASIFLGLLCLYRFAPYRRSARWRWILPGALLSSIGWLIFSYAFSLYISFAPDFGEEFGSLSAVVVLMLWLYYSVMVIVFGALLNAELEHQTGRDSTVGPPKPIGQRGAYVADHLADSSEP